MSFMTTEPEAMVAAAGALAGIGGEIAGTNAGMVAPTTGVLPAGLDEVSALVAAQFAAHAAMYHGMQGMGSAMHAEMVATLVTSAGGYAAAEVANAAAML
jgi:hypothetical protein